VTTVKIYGFLAKEFGNTIKVHLGKISDALNAIDAIKNGFRKKINELNKNKFNYSVYFDSKNKILHILPMIGGNSKVWKWVVTVILVIAAAVAAYFGQPGLSMMFLQLAFGMAKYAAMKPPPPPPKQPDQSIGGATYSTEAAGKNYIFDNLQNISSQGSIVNFGYGRYKTASKILAISVKTYPSNISFVEESEFLTNAEKVNIYD
jgi:predicted phage tail protein